MQNRCILQNAYSEYIDNVHIHSSLFDTCLKCYKQVKYAKHVKLDID